MKKKIISFSIISAVLLALVVVATIFDLSISQSMARVEGLDVLVTIGSYGKLPAYLGLVIGFLLVYSGLNDRLHNTIFLLFVKICNIMCIIISMYLLLDYILVDFKIFNIIVALVIGIVLVGVTERYRACLSHLFYFGLLVVGTIALSAVLIEAFKLFMCRERFYVIHGVSDYASFTEWYRCMLFEGRTPKYLLSHGIDTASWWGMDEYMSFPSGHAGMVSTILLLNFLPYYIPKTSKYKWLILVASILLTAFVCFTRVLALMHYMTDVLFGVIFTLIAMMIAYFVVNFIKKYMFKE